jgi:hypothetical protein
MLTIETVERSQARFFANPTKENGAEYLRNAREHVGDRDRGEAVDVLHHAVCYVASWLESDSNPDVAEMFADMRSELEGAAPPSRKDDSGAKSVLGLLWASEADGACLSLTWPIRSSCELPPMPCCTLGHRRAWLCQRRAWPF